ncbi:MAG: protein-glutamine gamma-glutamyltransferase [Oscillospiraceae bacterium]|nr:protein-glutamine gamma-glutamyltransferase [Oscillospiraceae bacterium]
MATDNTYAEFEKRLRTETVKAATDLKNSGMGFAIFENTRCNPDYWFRTDNGGWRLKSTAKPSEAITDIFTNGGAYATECATAMSIVYFKALLEVYGAEAFDNTFKGIYLMDWDIREPLLRSIATPVKVSEILPGDRAYFKNPDVDPKTPQWQGENVIVMGDGMYYGHGIGLADADYLIKSLNARRKPDSTRSAYMMSEVSRPDFKRLADALHNPNPAIIAWRHFPTSRTPQAGEHTFV